MRERPRDHEPKPAAQRRHGNDASRDVTTAIASKGETGLRSHGNGPGLRRVYRGLLPVPTDRRSRAVPYT